jgi:hypothetical protein
MVVSHDGKRLFVVTGRDKHLHPSTLPAAVAGLGRSGATPLGRGFESDGSRLFTANGSSNDVTVDT